MESLRAAVWIAATLLVSAVAADGAEPRVRLGVFGGAVRSDLSIADPDAPPFARGAIFRPDLGVSADIRLGGPFSLDVRAMWTERGARLTFEEFDELSPQVRFGYLSMPVLLKATHRRGRVRPYGVAGLELAWRRTAQTVLQNEVVGRLSHDIMSITRPIDVRARFGAGVEIPRGRTALFVETTYAVGLRNVVRPEDDEDVFEDQSVVKTRGLAVNAGIRF